MHRMTTSGVRPFFALWGVVTSTLLVVATLLPSQFARAAGDAAVVENPLTAKAKMMPSRIEEGGTAEVVIDMELADHYHAYLDRFKLAIETPDDLKLDHFKITPVVQFMDTFSKKMKDGVEKKAQMRAIVEVPKGFKAGSHTAKIKLTYQACTTEHCLFPKHMSLDAPFDVVAFGTVSAVSGGSSGSGASVEPEQVVAAAPAAAPSAGGSEFQNALGKGTLSALLFVFVVGFLTSLTPCIYPMIPITLAVLGARTKGQSKVKSFSLSFTYVLGIALTYSILGVTAAKTGALFGSALSNVYVVTAIALLFVAMGLSMYGLFELQVPAIIRDKIGTAKTGSGYGGAFATGLIAGVVASPCVGPVLVSVLTYIAQTQNMVLGFMLLFTFAMGMGILFMILGTSSALIGKVPKAGAWMEIVKFVFGTVMVAMALYYVKPLYPAWLFNTLLGLAAILIASAYGAFEPNEKLEGAGRVRKGAMLATFIVGLAFMLSGVLEKAGVPLLPAGGVVTAAAAGESYPKLAWQPFSASAVEEAVKAKKPVLIDFYADWCGACKELEKYTFTDQRIRDLSEKFVLLKVDATEDRPELDALKKQYAVMGLPTMIFYDTTGVIRNDLTVTGFEEADQFLKRMQSASSGQQLSQSSTASN